MLNYHTRDKRNLFHRTRLIPPLQQSPVTKIETVGLATGPPVAKVARWYVVPSHSVTLCKGGY
jgi:hypothetical protein